MTLSLFKRQIQRCKSSLGRGEPLALEGLDCRFLIVFGKDLYKAQERNKKFLKEETKKLKKAIIKNNQIGLVK